MLTYLLRSTSLYCTLGVPTKVMCISWHGTQESIIFPKTVPCTSFRQCKCGGQIQITQPRTSRKTKEEKRKKKRKEKEKKKRGGGGGGDFKIDLKEKKIQQVQRRFSSILSAPPSHVFPSLYQWWQSSGVVLGPNCKSWRLPSNPPPPPPLPPTPPSSCVGLWSSRKMSMTTAIRPDDSQWCSRSASHSNG